MPFSFNPFNWKPGYGAKNYRAPAPKKKKDPLVYNQNIPIPPSVGTGIGTSPGGGIGLTSRAPQVSPIKTRPANVGTTTAFEGGRGPTIAQTIRDYIAKNPVAPTQNGLQRAAAGASGIPTGAPAADVPISVGSGNLGGGGLASLQQLMDMFKPQGGNLNINLPALPVTDYKPIYDKWAPLAEGIGNQLIQQFAAMKPEIEARNAAEIGRVGGMFDKTNTDVKSRTDAAKAAIQAQAERLGMSDQLLRPSITGLDENAIRLAGLAGLQQQARLGEQKELGSARMGNFDTAQQLAAGQKARTMNDILSAVSEAELGSRADRLQAEAQMRLASATGQTEYAKLLAGQRDNALSNALSVWRTLQDQEMARQKALQEDNPLTGQFTETQENEDFYNALGQTTKNPAYSSLWQRAMAESGGNLGDAQIWLNNFYKANSGIQDKPIQLGMPGGSFVGGGGKFVNTGRLPEADIARQLLDLFPLLQTGMSTKQTNTYKV